MSNSVHLPVTRSTIFFVHLLHGLCVQLMIYNKYGQRKYLTINERNAYLAAAKTMKDEDRMFCLVLAYTGARISEVLALSSEHVDLEAGVIVIESLKKRRRGIFRGVPVPQSLLSQLDKIYGIKSRRDDISLRTSRLWPWSRTTAWKRVKVTMDLAGISPALSVPKALRHAFGVGAIQKNVPLNVLQKWMGHSRISTTAIYADAVGDEERYLANRMWE